MEGKGKEKSYSITDRERNRRYEAVIKVKEENDIETNLNPKH